MVSNGKNIGERSEPSGGLGTGKGDAFPLLLSAWNNGPLCHWKSWPTILLLNLFPARFICTIMSSLTFSRSIGLFINLHFNRYHNSRTGFANIASVLFCYFVFFFSAVDHCFSSPCRNNRTCTSFLNHYECDCGEDFSGTNCEEGLFICLKLYLFFMLAGNSRSPSQITKNQVLGCCSS